ncbi:MAG: hypothetical protein HOK52_14860 [Candidatus Marinimicrobia bacterium]|jgi:hypothetical protein|nr:hypothetical protein [Candidatus Neomarinimicrobiota bacterium]
MDKIEHTCNACEMEYKIRSTMAVLENVQTRYCPYCGTENIDDLDFEEGYEIPLNESDDEDFE